MRQGSVPLEQMSSHLKFTKLKAMRCADANKSARAKLGWRQRGFPVWPTPCLVYAGQTDREIDSLAANDSWLLSPSASEIRTAEPLCCCCCSPNGLEVSPHLARERVSNACWHLHNSPVAAENTWLAPSTQNENPYPNPTGIRSKPSPGPGPSQISITITQHGHRTVTTEQQAN